LTAQHIGIHADAFTTVYLIIFPHIPL